MYLQLVTVSLSAEFCVCDMQFHEWVSAQAVGCAAKMILQNKKASEFTLRVLRSSPSEQEISGCANHLDAGRYQMEVFDIEESGVLGSTAAVVICAFMPQPTQVMLCECDSVSTKYTCSFLSPNLATPLSTDRTSTYDPYGPIRYIGMPLLHHDH